MSKFENTPYLTRIPKDSLVNSTVFLSVIKQYFFPTIHKDKFCINAEGFTNVYKDIQTAVKHHFDIARLNGFREAHGLHALSADDHALWKESKTFSLLVDEEKAGRAKITLSIAGYVDDVNINAPVIDDIGETRPISFYVTSFLKDGVYMVLFDLTAFEEKSFEDGLAVPLPLTPILSYPFRSKGSADLRPVKSLIGDVTAKINKEGLSAVRWALDLDDEVSESFLPMVDTEDVYEQISAAVLAWYSWNGGYDEPIQFHYSAMVVPVIDVPKAEVGSASTYGGSLKVVYRWKHMFEIASGKVFSIPLVPLDMV